MKRLVFALASLLPTACDDPDVAPKTTVLQSDPSYSRSRCALPSGTSIIIEESKIDYGPARRDFNGDGVADNAFALGFGALYDLSFKTSIDNRTIFNVMHVADWGSAQEPQLGLAYLAAIDADQPPNKNNDFTPQAHFWVDPQDFDVNCRPINVSDMARWESPTEFHSYTKSLVFLTRGFGKAELALVQLDIQVNGERATINMSAAWPACTLSKTKVPTVTNLTTLDAFLAKRPLDVDIDGDGLEVVKLRDGAAASCVDGDGTIIEGATCPCDPRIADGVSAQTILGGPLVHVDGIWEGGR
jgi:hypothetical protein